MNATLFKGHLAVQTTATGLHPLLVAAHQPIYGLWSLLSFGHVPTEQAALAYLPGVTSRREASELIWVLLVLGATIGVVTAIAAGVVPIFAPRIFSPDVRLWPHMCAVVPQVIALYILERLNWLASPAGSLNCLRLQAINNVHQVHGITMSGTLLGSRLLALLEAAVS